MKLQPKSSFLEPTIYICFAELSDPNAKTTIRTTSDKALVTVTNKIIVFYHQTTFSLEVAETARASIAINEAGFYLFVLATGALSMEREGTEGFPIKASRDHCQAIYLCTGTYFMCFSPGKHRIICLASSSDWVQRFSKPLPSIAQFSANRKPYQQARIFPRYRLPKVWANYLLSLAYQTADEIASISTLEHFHQLNHILAHYDGLLAQALQADGTGKQYEKIVHDFIQHSSRTLLLSEIPTIERLATTIHVSPKTLNRAFNHVSKHTLTPARMLQYIRMEAAHRLLSNDNLSVQQTAHLLGYADTSAFTKAYQKVLGHLPSEAHLYPGKGIGLSAVRNKPLQMSESN